MPLYLSLSHSFSLYCSLHLLCPPLSLAFSLTLSLYLSLKYPRVFFLLTELNQGAGKCPCSFTLRWIPLSMYNQGVGEGNIHSRWCYKPPAFSLFLLTIVCGCAFKETASIQQYRLFPTEKNPHIGNNTRTF